MSHIQLDGSRGEGGGQILRSALSLSAITGRPFTIDKIRAGRKKPGLLRQHLTAVRAAQQVCNAQVSGDELSSRQLHFEPGPIRAGEYRFAVGTAGSACLVAQTVLPVLLCADSECRVTCSGGTDNPSAPPFGFLDGVYAVALRKLGVPLSMHIERRGFYPAGGGSFAFTTSPWVDRKRVHWRQAGYVASIRVEATLSKLPRRIAEVELETVRQLWAERANGRGLPELSCHVNEVASRGPGNTLSIFIERDLPELVTAFGAQGRPAPRVAEDAVEQAMAFVGADVPVGEHLADQLLIPFSLAGGGTFRTVPLSEHTKTNMSVIEEFLDVTFRTASSGPGTSVIVQIGADP